MKKPDAGSLAATRDSGFALALQALHELDAGTSSAGVRLADGQHPVAGTIFGAPCKTLRS
jgi:hypothetical protein